MIVNARVPTSVTQKAKSGNVLALLDTFYLSGFATYIAPSNPMLKGRTLHTLYAFSFLIYSLNCICDWIHVYCLLRGFVTTFPLQTWLVIALVTTVVCGSMLTALLLVLCVENAFISRMRITPYRSGFSVIAEAIIEWVQAFNNFRVAFLVMLLHDAPMTFMNFFLISACRCPGSEIWPWSLLMSSLSTIVSVVWRLTMLYFSYRRMLFPSIDKRSQIAIQQHQPFLDHLAASCSINDGGRLSEFDETWPFRWARHCLYRCEHQTVRTDRYVTYLKSDLCPSECRLPEISRNICGICCGCVLVKGLSWIKTIVKALAFGFIATIGYVFYLATFCIPCCVHYTCRTGSFYSRHRCAKSCVRYFSVFFHYAIFVCSLVGVVLILSANVILISSVHVIGINQIPPELDQICVDVNRDSHIIRSLLKPSKNDQQLVCKPIWENRGIGWTFQRVSAGPWQTRIPISKKVMIIVSTQLVMNYSDHPGTPSQTLLYDYAVLIGIDEGERFRCRSGDATIWRYDPSLHIEQLPWPYFSGCLNSLGTERRRMINCEGIEQQQHVGVAFSWLRISNFFPIMPSATMTKTKKIKCAETVMLPRKKTVKFAEPIVLPKTKKLKYIEATIPSKTKKSKHSSAEMPPMVKGKDAIAKPKQKAILKPILKVTPPVERSQPRQSSQQQRETTPEVVPDYCCCWEIMPEEPVVFKTTIPDNEKEAVAKFVEKAKKLAAKGASRKNKFKGLLVKMEAMFTLAQSAYFVDESDEEGRFYQIWEAQKECKALIKEAKLFQKLPEKHFAMRAYLVLRLTESCLFALMYHSLNNGHEIRMQLIKKVMLLRPSDEAIEAVVNAKDSPTRGKTDEVNSESYCELYLFEAQQLNLFMMLWTSLEIWRWVGLHMDQLEKRFKKALDYVCDPLMPTTPLNEVTSWGLTAVAWIRAELDLGKCRITS
ncbi:hypothetical protein QR680_000380 [Steinernema hermaphroditum]|uniref:Uncharacterized protein n=1 Tax=Steinernema hermaphroditum TaxID=289476 RepID=A0AA39LE25_9BILA|nr:hypothetical protein QR680_000380 [Steinernema hermaphroditum]